jgi:hypothetical protein
MKLNEKGMALYNIWYENYCKENDNLGGNSAEGDFVEGWCIIDNFDYIKNITDECGLLIYGYDEDAVNTVDEWIEDYGDEEIGNLGFTYTDVRNELLKYFEEDCLEVIQVKKINCPICNKELIRLEPFEKGIYEFWCDDCDTDIVITKNK